MDGDLVAQLVRVDMMHNAARTNISGGAPMYIHAISVGKGMFKALSCPPIGRPESDSGCRHSFAVQSPPRCSS